MKICDIKHLAYNLIENSHIENDYIEYKKSLTFKGKILKTLCAYANNYMNNEIGLLFIGIDEMDNRSSGEKAIPKRPIIGVKESLIETTENCIKSLISNIHPKIEYKIIDTVFEEKQTVLFAPTALTEERKADVD